MANQTFLVSDGQGDAVPVSLLKLAAAMVAKRDVAQRLCGSLQVDIEKNPAFGLEPAGFAG